MLFKWNLQPDYFNPRSHEGSDTLEKYIYATGTDFNPRSHEGSDWNTVEINRNHYGFQSALPRGERPGQIGMCGRDELFQSALPRGERHRGAYDEEPGIEISIRAPTRGATHFISPDDGSNANFNPRSHEGSDRCCGGKCIRLIISIRAPTRGATIRKMLQSTQRRYFNPRSHEGSD